MISTQHIPSGLIVSCIKILTSSEELRVRKLQQAFIFILE